MGTLAKNFGIETAILTPEETKKLFPLINTETIEGSLYCPSDGVVDPSMFCKAVIYGAKQAGAEVEDFIMIKYVIL